MYFTIQSEEKELTMNIKYILVLFSFFVLLPQSLLSETKLTNERAVKALIEKVKTVAPSERRILMNELKITLRSMHKETRKQVMLQLRSTFNKEPNNQRHTAIQSNTHHQSTMSMSESKNMQEHMNRGSMPNKRPPSNRPPGNRPMRGM